MRTRNILLRFCAGALFLGAIGVVDAQSPPALVASAPADGQPDIPLNTTVSFTFNEPMQPGYSVNWSGEVPSRTNSWSADQRTLTYTFLELLPPNTLITWELNPTNFSPKFKNLAGVALPPGQYFGSFDTGTNLLVTLTGQVLCSCDWSPVPDASVQIGTNDISLTDGNGSYAISNILSGTYSATVAANNHLTFTNTIQIPSDMEVFTNDFHVTNSTLVINPVFDATITNDANAGIITNAIKSAIEVYKQTIANPLCLKILFVGTNDLAHPGASTVANTTISYSQYRTDLQANTNKSVNDLTSLATLTANSGTGTNGNSQTLYLTAANLLAIGEFGKAANAVALPEYGGYHGIIKLDVSPQFLSIKLARLQSVASHEINEVLGIGGYGSSVGLQDDTIGPLDLFRYSSDGVRSFTTNASAKAYFSINGGITTNVFFSQTSGMDSGDWGNGFGPTNNPPQVQDANRTENPPMNPSMRENEFIALDVIGYGLLSPTPIIQSATYAANSFSFGWPTLPGKLYQVQSTTNLTGNVWTDVGSPITSTDMTTAISDTNATAPKQFYRVIVLPPPAGP